MVIFLAHDSQMLLQPPLIKSLISMGSTVRISKNLQDLPPQTQNSPNPGTESSDLTPKPQARPSAAPTGAIRAPVSGFGVRSDDSVHGFGEFLVCRGKSCRFFDRCPVDPMEIELSIKGGCRNFFGGSGWRWSEKHLGTCTELSGPLFTQFGGRPTHF